jgi:GTP pyrophosphokinase
MILTPTRDLLNRAYVFSMQAHGAQTRASGDPYFSHPLEVAGILTEMKMDSIAIATALLHDTVEDTAVTLQDIEKQFGITVARLVDGVTKLSRIEIQVDQVASKPRIFVSLFWPCPRIFVCFWSSSRTGLHNMRTLHFVPDSEKRRRKPARLWIIYAPWRAYRHPENAGRVAGSCLSLN